MSTAQSAEKNVSGKTQTAKEQVHEAVDGGMAQARDASARVSSTINKRMRPAQDYIEQQLSRRPISTATQTFLAIFLALSAVPIMSFLLFAVSVTIVVSGIAVATSLAILGFVLGTAGKSLDISPLLLGGTLLVTSLVAATATTWVGGIFAFYRFLVCVSQAPSLQEGVKSFLHEVKSTFVGERGGLQIDTKGDVKAVAFKVES
ncbi:hypothetical protein OIV83_000195 [Microbotryomycetes sp. JL201]|nr:hypothetical protein OIV83_000195 [Microbotryomycetes sp. JL201]